VEKLRAGKWIYLSGVVYAARDATHRRLLEDIQKGDMPVNLKGQVIYYMGPTPAPPGRVIGAAGPTTSGRMDRYTPELLKMGLKGMIGKGKRSREVREAIVKHRGVYFCAIGGAGALASERIVSAEVVAYPELGPEALLKLELRDFPLVVANDIYGNDIFEMALKKWRKF